MDLNELIKKPGQDLLVWVEFKGLEIELIYADRVTIDGLVNRSKITIYRKHQPLEQLNESLVLKNISRLINDWRITLGQLAELIHMDIGDQDPETKVPCTEANKVALLTNLYDFDTFVFDTVTELQNFRAGKMEEEIKNSGTSRGVDSA